MILYRKLLIGAVIGSTFGALHWFGVGNSIEELAFDVGLRLSPEREATRSVQLVTVDDEDIKQFGQWPIPRGAHVSVIQMLHALKVKSTCFDIIFGEPSKQPDHDTAFRDIVKSAGNVTLAYYFRDIGMDPSTDSGSHFVEGFRYGVDPDSYGFLHGVQPQPLFADFNTPVGAVNAKQTSQDKIIRRVPLFLSHGGKLYPTIAMQAVIQAYQLEPDQIRIEVGRNVSLIGTPQGRIRIPIDEHCQMRVSFDSTESLIRRSKSYLDLFRAASDQSLAHKFKPDFEDSITFVGNASTGNTDVVLTRNGPMSGVVVQAAVAENILSGRFLRTLPQPIEVLLIILAGSLAALGVHGAHPWRSLGVISLMITVWTLVTLGALRQGHILPYVPVCMAAMATMLLLYAAQNSRVVARFGGYVPSALRKVLLSSETDEERPLRRELTIFFSDIRGFTDWSEKTDPDEMAEVLNEYLSAMTEIVEKHAGTLDKFIGDSVMVFFGAPVAREDHAEAALKMAWEMQAVMETLNDKWAKKGRASLRAGIGLNSGFVTFGNFGSKHFKDYTVIGREVNLAARIESFTPGGMILISDRTNAMVQDIASTRLFAEFNFKGISKPVAVHEVLAIKGGVARSSESESADWLCEDCTNHGPYTTAGLIAMVKSGRISSDAIVRHVDKDQLIPLSSLHTANP